jgi:hypothetical protein
MPLWALNCFARIVVLGVMQQDGKLAIEVLAAIGVAHEASCLSVLHA